MNEEAKQALSEIIQKAADGIDGAVLFTQEHLPDVVHQLLLWEMVESIIWCVPAVIILISLAIFHRCMWRDNGWGRRRSTGEIDADAVAFAFVTTFASLTLSLVLFSFTWLQILIAPKLYLLEYAAGLVS